MLVGHQLKRPRPGRTDLADDISVLSGKKPGVPMSVEQQRPTILVAQTGGQIL